MYYYYYYYHYYYYYYFLSAGRRLPSSATTSHTRPMSQLDEALKQFKLSTAASRENIRNSRQDLSQMEEQVGGNNTCDLA